MTSFLGDSIMTAKKHMDRVDEENERTATH